MRFGQVMVIPVGGTGPEDVLVDGTGRVYTGVEDGRILRINPDGGRVTVLGETGGRPLGLEFNGPDELLICDAKAGLLTMPVAGGDPLTLTTSVAGKDLLFCNNAAVAQDGTIYFTDSSDRFGIDHWRDDLIEQTGSGRLLRRDVDGRFEVLAEGLQFANGVALPPDESFVAFAETGAFRVRRLWLKGERAGETDTLIEKLWGFPDNISTGTDGLIWITQASPRVAALDLVRKLPAGLRSVIRSLPPGLQPSPGRQVGVLGVAPDGEVRHELRGTISGFHMLVGVREQNGRLYFGSLSESAIAVTAKESTVEG